VMPPGLAQALGPVLEQIAQMTLKIKQYDRQIQQLGQTEYPETQVQPRTVLAWARDSPILAARCRDLRLRGPDLYPTMYLLPGRSESSLTAT